MALSHTTLNVQLSASFETDNNGLVTFAEACLYAAEPLCRAAHLKDVLWRVDGVLSAQQRAQLEREHHAPLLRAAPRRRVDDAALRPEV